MSRTLLWWLLTLLCLMLGACAEDMSPASQPSESAAPAPSTSPSEPASPPPPLFQDTFDNSASNYTFFNDSTMAGGFMGTASGEISAGRLLLNATGTLFPFFSNGTCGAMRAVLSSGMPTLAANQVYRITLQYRATPPGSATSGNRFTVNGTTFGLIANTDTTQDFIFTAPATPSALALSFATFSCNDQGLVLPSQLIVYAITITAA
jgi:hypothetical protein